MGIYVVVVFFTIVIFGFSIFIRLFYFRANEEGQGFPGFSNYTSTAQMVGESERNAGILMIIHTRHANFGEMERTNERTPMRCVHIPCSTQQKLLCNCVCTVIIAVILTLLAHTLDRLVLPLSSHSQPILVDAPFFVVFVCLFLFDSSLSLFLFFDLFSSLFFRSLSTTFPSLLSRCRTFLYLLYSTNEHVSNVFDCNHLRRRKKIALCLVLEYFST